MNLKLYNYKIINIYMDTSKMVDNIKLKSNRVNMSKYYKMEFFFALL